MSGLDLFGNVSAIDDGGRNEFDFYPTPGWMTRSLLLHHPAIVGTRVLECASGNDAITIVMREEGGCWVATNDIDKRHPAETHFDATTAAFWKVAPQVDWIVTNPPFGIAFDMLQFALAHSPGVAMLLRKTFLEPTEERGGFLMANPPTHVIGLPRHKFRQDSESQDSVSCDWMIWSPSRLVAMPAGARFTQRFIIDAHAKGHTRRLTS